MATPIPNDMIIDSIIDFLASSPSNDEILAFRPPPALQSRLNTLLTRNRSSRLSVDEQRQLDECLLMNRLIGRLKLKARQESANNPND